MPEEHEHFDKLAITLRAFGTDIAPDLGNLGLRRPHALSILQNTATHNTAVIDESNQPPVNARLVRYELKEQGIYLEAEADFSKDTRPRPTAMPQAVERRNIRRRIHEPQAFLESQMAGGSICGTNRPPAPDRLGDAFQRPGLQNPRNRCCFPFSQNPPFCFLEKNETPGRQPRTWQTHTKPRTFYTTIYASQQNHHLYQGLDPGNPSMKNHLSNRTYLRKTSRHTLPPY